MEPRSSDAPAVTPTPGLHARGQTPATCTGRPQSFQTLGTLHASVGALLIPFGGWK